MGWPSLLTPVHDIFNIIATSHLSLGTEFHLVCTRMLCKRAAVLLISSIRPSDGDVDPFGSGLLWCHKLQVFLYSIKKKCFISFQQLWTWKLSWIISLTNKKLFVFHSQNMSKCVCPYEIYRFNVTNNIWQAVFLQVQAARHYSKNGLIHQFQVAPKVH